MSYEVILECIHVADVDFVTEHNTHTHTQIYAHLEYIFYDGLSNN